MNWVKCDKICREKEEGGMWIKNIWAFNLALLGKWEWRFLNEKDTLWVKILKCKYGRIGQEASRANKFKSLWWRDIQSIDIREGGFKAH